MSQLPWTPDLVKAVTLFPPSTALQCSTIVALEFPDNNGGPPSKCLTFSAKAGIALATIIAAISAAIDRTKSMRLMRYLLLLLVLATSCRLLRQVELWRSLTLGTLSELPN
jgi:hypothetical protein